MAITNIVWKTLFCSIIGLQFWNTLEFSRKVCQEIIKESTLNYHFSAPVSHGLEMNVV